MRLVLTITSTSSFALNSAYPAIAGHEVDYCDFDGLPDAVDNCMCVNNSDQCDTDQDGYGNTCDADVNNDGGIGVPDYGPITANFGQPTAAFPAADVNCDGGIGVPDYGPITKGFGGAPGPSGLSCAGTIPCP